MIFLKELEYMTKEEFESNFSNKDIEGLWGNLLKRNIIKYNNLNKFCFHYVGLINYDDIFIAINPKYIDVSKNNKDEFCGIFKLLKILYLDRKIDKTIFLGNEIEAENNGSMKLYNSIMILKDYILNGVYEEEISIRETNGSGEIDWETTVDFYDPLVFDEQFIYTEYATNEIEFTEASIITKIQINLLNEILMFFKSKDLPELLDMNIDFNIPSYELLEDTDFYLGILTKKLDLQYNDKKVQMLKNMINYIEDERGKIREYEMCCFGVRHFEHIWEYLCSDVLNNEFMKVEQEYKLRTPKWLISNKEWYNKKNILKPDIIKFGVINENKYLMILDAKYYVPKYSDGKIVNNPGISDITKQYLYQKLLEDYIVRNKIEYVYNILLFPTTCVTECIGVVELDFMSNVENLIVMNINVNEFIDLFIARKKISCEKIWKLLGNKKQKVL